jgi:hypothetical protein
MSSASSGVEAHFPSGTLIPKDSRSCKEMYSWTLRARTAPSLFDAAIGEGRRNFRHIFFVIVVLAQQEENIMPRINCSNGDLERDQHSDELTY